MPDLRRLLAPRSIAVVGGAPAERVVAQCRKLGFEGPIWPVHPSRPDLAGVPCLASLDDLPDVPDAVFLGVNRHATVQAVRQLATMGAGGAVCYGSGFAESGEAALQQDLLEAAGELPLFGPNCYGFVNTFDRVALWPDEHGMVRHDRAAAIVSQSGNVAVNLTFQQRGLRLGHMVTVGNQASVGTEDVIDALLDDERVTAIGLFLEAVKDPQRFATVAARAVLQRVPLVALQTGRSAAGAAIATSHTGSMAGRAAAYDALFERTGVPQVHTPSELLETLKLVDRGGRMRGRRVVSLSCSGGEASLVADRSEATRLHFEPFAPEHVARIERTLTELVTVSNPFDYHTFMWGDRAAMSAAFTAVMDGPQDVTMLVLDAPPSPDNDPSSWYVAAEALADAADATGGRAVLVATMAECLNERFRDHVAGRGLVPLLGLGEALVALDAAAHVGAQVSPPHAPVTSPGATRLIDEASAKSRLRGLGVAVPDGGIALRDDVLATAEAIGYPVTLKALGLAHKSEAGAVKVGIEDAELVSAALWNMPATELGYLVESTVTDVVAEVLVAVRRDPPVGWLVTLGFGGVHTELWNDVVHLLAPVSEEQVIDALGRLRSARLLHGYRGRPAADVAALARLVVALTEGVVGTDVVEVELNPVLVGRRGATAVDALWIEEVS
ncbi:MAG: acetate--CoA ligase family protein [Acidimicrobiales bacterium]|nr:acetate--CoA ligase family protein [Acidimicrobiales bacterium]MCB9394365.1 acetate--CoA ligase family protein [Acidimicrobiaceae bacterium]